MLNVTCAATLRRRCDPRGLRGQGLIATLRWTPATSDQQFGHRAAVAGVALQRSQELLAACIFHRSRVEFDDLQTGRSQPCDEGAVIVARCLDADPDDERVALDLRASDRRGQHREAGFGQRELEWGDDDLAIVIGDQSHRGGLAYVHRYGQTALRIDPPNPGHEPRLHIAVHDVIPLLPSCRMSTDSAGVHGHRRVGEPAWRNAIANQASDDFDPHNQGGISNGTNLVVFVA